MFEYGKKNQLSKDTKAIKSDLHTLNTDVHKAATHAHESATSTVRKSWSSATNQAADFVADGKDRAAEFTQNAKDQVHNAKEAVLDKAHDVKAAGESIIDHSKERAGEYIGEAEDAAHGLYDSFRSYLGGAKDKVDDAKDNVENKLKEAAQAAYDEAENLYMDVVERVYKARKHAQHHGEKIASNVEQGYKDAIDAARRKRDDLLNAHQPSPPSKWFGIRRDSDAKKRAADTAKDHWFTFKSRAQEAPDKAAEAAEALAKEAVKRKDRIETKLHEMTDEARSEALKLRNDIANMFRTLEFTESPLSQARTSFDDSMTEILKRFDELGAKIRASLTDKTVPSDLRINELVNAAKSKLHGTVSAVENKYAEADKKGRTEFNIAVAKAGDIKGDYVHVRDRASKAARQAREQALRDARDEYDRVLAEVKDDFAKGAKAVADYGTLSKSAADQKKRQAKRYISAAEHKLANAGYDARDRLDQLEKEMKYIWKDAVDEVAGWGDKWNVRLAIEDVRARFGNAWDQATKTISSTQTNIHDALDHVPGRIKGIWESNVLPGQPILWTIGEGTPGINLPIATFGVAFFSIWFVYLSNRVWRKRRAADVWVGDGTIESVKATFDTENVHRNKRASAAAVAERVDDLSESRLPLYTALSSAVADLNSFTTTAPFMLLLLSVMELNGYSPNILLSLYFGLAISRYLQQSNGQALLGRLGLRRDLGTFFTGALLLCVTTLCSWGVILATGGLPGLPIQAATE